MNKLIKIINEEINELGLPRKGKDLYWRGINPKGKMEKGKDRFARERDMNDDTYKLRREVMNYVYRAKKILRKKFGYELPRQRIRIIDVDVEAFIPYEGKYVKAFMLGCASMGGNDIYIPADTITDGRYSVQKVVYHEILHSAFCVPHIEDSPLMCSSGSWEDHKLSPEEYDELFLKHAKESGKI